jgi:hypothetical protein
MYTPISPRCAIAATTGMSWGVAPPPWVGRVPLCSYARIATAIATITNARITILRILRSGYVVMEAPAYWVK